MTQPNKGQLIRDWQLATSEAMQALLQWQKQLEVWLSQEVITDGEFMTAYGNLANEIGFDWVDTVLLPDKGIDQLRETLTGVDPINGMSPYEPPSDWELELLEKEYN